MKGIQFPESNYRLLPPEGHEDEVYELYTWTNGEIVISKWKMSLMERFTVLFTGTVWAEFWGRTHPPMLLKTNYPWVKGKVK